MSQIPINYERLKAMPITDDMKAFVESQIGKEALGKISEEAWMDFKLGVALWGISVGLTKIV